MQNELQKLQIDKSHKARKEARPVWPLAIVLVGLLGGGIGFWQWSSHSTSTLVRTIRVTVPEASSTDDTHRALLNATGYVMAAHKIELASKVVGRVSWVGVEMGDRIHKGEVLVRLEDDEYRARVAQQQGVLDNAKAKLAELEAGSRPQEIGQAQALLDQSQAELTNAEINFKRLGDLEVTHSVSRQQIDDAEGVLRSRRALVESQRQLFELSKLGPRKEQIDAQKATVRELEGGLALAMVDLDNTVIRSSIEATVLERNVEVGEFVTTGFVGDRGAKGYVVSIADLNDLRVELDVSQNYVAKVTAQQPCLITTDAYPDLKYQGVVDLISPEANRQKASVLVRVKVLNPDGLLKPDMNATVAFLPSKNPTTGPGDKPAVEQRPAIRVPASAVRNGAVFVIEDGKALKRPVTLGLKLATGEVEITSGLIGGEDLIVNPPEALTDGDRVGVDTSTK